MISGALLSVLTWMGPGHAGSCSSCRASERQRENMTWAPSLERTCSPADLGRRTKQKVRATLWEREKLRGLQPAVWGDLQFTLKS